MTPKSVLKFAIAAVVVLALAIIGIVALQRRINDATFDTTNIPPELVTGITTSFTPANPTPSPSAAVKPAKEATPKPFVSEDWRVWGGAQRDFRATTVGIFKPGTEKLANPPKKLWERPLGDGYSAIAIEDRRLYTAYRRDANDVIVALDANTGNPIWEFTYAAPFENQYSSGAGPGPYAMPQIIGDRVVTASGIGQIHSLNKSDGKRVWSLDLYKDYGATRLGFGYSSHALPYKDSLIIAAGGSSHGVLKVRQSDGSVIWSKHKLENAHSSPLLINVEGQPQVALLLAQEVIGLDPEGGDILWRHPHPTQNGLAISTPVWADGNLLFISTAYSGGARALQLTRNGDKTEVRELWHNPRIQSHFGSAILQGGYVYLSSGQSAGVLTAVELQTGRIAWQVRDFVKAQLVSADGRLLILDEEGNFGVGLATPEGFQNQGQWPLLSRTAWSPPTVVGHRLYVRDRKVIMALEFGTLHG
jgi:outer membrane protein assembly factor BamB